MNSETNASIIAKAVNKPASTSHVHNDTYYPGTKHAHTGSCYSSYSYSYNCSGCQTKTINTGIDYHSPGCTPREEGAYDEEGNLVTVITGSYCPGHQNTETVTYCPGHTGHSSYLSCGKTEGEYYNGNSKVYPICSTQISSIVAANPTQTLYIKDPLITAVVTTYRDGSTKTVVATADSNTNIVAQNKTVTLTYSGLTTIIKITVIPKTKTCIYGHIYNLNNDGSDPGCVYCNSWLSKLEIVTPAYSRLIAFKGSSLEANGVVVKATYMNCRTELQYNGYAHNYDKNYIGVQIVTIGYKGLTIR